jgi:hypothetical protein
VIRPYNDDSNEYRRPSEPTTSGAQAIVERMIGDGLPLEDIEEFIETLALRSEQLAALWLLAWAEATDPLTRRQVVAETLAGDDCLPAPPIADAPSSFAHAPHDERRTESVRRRVRSHSRRGAGERRRLT